VKTTYKVGCSLCTCKCVEERRKGETRVLARLASPGVAWRWARAHDVRVNSPSKFGSKPHRPAASFYRFFFATSLCLIRFDRDRPSRLRDAVTLDRSSLYIRAAAIEIVIYQQP
jgi:hypothetical protein